MDIDYAFYACLKRYDDDMVVKNGSPPIASYVDVLNCSNHPLTFSPFERAIPPSSFRAESKFNVRIVKPTLNFLYSNELVSQITSPIDDGQRACGIEANLDASPISILFWVV